MVKSKAKETKIVTQEERDAKTVDSLQGTVAGEIWEEIKDKNIEMFALPSQIVSMHVHPVNIEPTKLYLLLNSTAVLPSLEVAIGTKYVVEMANKFTIVSRTAVSPTGKR